MVIPYGRISADTIHFRNICVIVLNLLLLLSQLTIV